MPSDAAAALRDMERNIDLASEFVAGIDYEAFRDAHGLCRNPVP